MTTEPAAWLTCSSCKGEIGFEEAYYVCSVSTCQRGSTDFRFCSVECWDTHVPTMRHRDASAIERLSPAQSEWAQELDVRRAAEREREAREAERFGEEGDEGAAIELREGDLPQEVLVVVSKVKAWIRARSGMNTSDGVMPVLSDHLRRVCDEAVRRAARDGRKTVLDRDLFWLD